MPYPQPTCIFCGYFRLFNGRKLQIRPSQELSSIVVYDTSVTATSGSTMRARLFIANQVKFSDGSIICAITKGGPMPPHGYLLHVYRIVPDNYTPPLYRNAPQYSRLTATGKVISNINKTSSGDLSFDLETVTDINGNLCNWVFRYASFTFVSLQFSQHGTDASSRYPGE